MTDVALRNPTRLAAARRLAIAAPLAWGLAFAAPALAAEGPAAAPPAAEAPAPEAPAAPDPLDLEDAEPLDLSALPWRHGQLQLHQAFGLGTLGAMAATGGLGYWLSRQNGSSGVFDAHLLMAGLTTGLYLTSATLALTAPPSPLHRTEGPWDTTRLHRNLGWLHAAGMAGTIGMGLFANYNSLSYSQYHALAAYSTIGLMALSAGVIAFGE
jgi:hypothetical protein